MILSKQVVKASSTRVFEGFWRQVDVYSDLPEYILVACNAGSVSGQVCTLEFDDSGVVNGFGMPKGTTIAYGDYYEARRLHSRFVVPAGMEFKKLKVVTPATLSTYQVDIFLSAQPGLEMMNEISVGGLKQEAYLYKIREFLDDIKDGLAVTGPLAVLLAEISGKLDTSVGMYLSSMSGILTDVHDAGNHKLKVDAT